MTDDYINSANRSHAASSIPPLAGIRVVAIEQYGAGPFATSLLADMGAEIIKVETSRQGDVGRAVPPYAQDGDSLYFESLNRNKKSVYIDTASERGAKSLRELISTCDAVLNNLRGDQPATRGLDYAALADINPRVVCVHLSGFGREGDYAAEPAYDYLMQGYAGWMTLTGEPGAPPSKTGLSMVDFSAGMLSALALVSGVRSAEVTGQGRDLDVPLIDVSLSLLNYLATWHLSRGYEPTRQADSSHPSQVPSQILPTADGWMVVMCAKEKFFRRLVEVMGVPQLADDERFHDFAARLANRDLLIAMLKDISVQRTTAQWLAELRGKVPSGPVHTVAEAFKDPVVLSRNMIVETDHPTLGRVRSMRSPISHGAPITPRRAPRLGEHNDELLGSQTPNRAAAESAHLHDPSTLSAEGLPVR